MPSRYQTLHLRSFRTQRCECCSIHAARSSSATAPSPGHRFPFATFVCVRLHSFGDSTKVRLLLVRRAQLSHQSDPLCLIRSGRHHFKDKSCRNRTWPIRSHPFIFISARPSGPTGSVMAGLVPMLRHRAPVLAFTAMCAGAAYAVYYAHHQQVTEKKVRPLSQICLWSTSIAYRPMP